jgi:capsular polysaccharide transport system permease protein
LQLARIQAQKQQLFLEAIVAPNLPDEALLPHRLRNILATFLIGTLLWGIFSVIFAGIREHNDR